MFYRYVCLGGPDNVLKLHCLIFDTFFDIRRRLDRRVCICRPDNVLILCALIMYFVFLTLLFYDGRCSDGRVCMGGPDDVLILHGLIMHLICLKLIFHIRRRLDRRVCMGGPDNVFCSPACSRSLLLLLQVTFMQPHCPPVAHS